MPDVGYAPWLSDPDEPDDMTDAEIAAAGDKAAEFMRNRGLLDFDPNEARDPHGRWTEVGGGAGYEFYSPAVGQSRQLNEAVAGLSSNRQRLLREASQEIDSSLDLPSRDTSAVGAWSDGAENSIVSAIIADPPWAKLEVSGAMKGHIADQKAVLVFKQQDGGNSALYHMQVAESDPQKLHESLLADGVAFHTIVPHPVGSEVYVADLDGSAHDAMAKAAERYDAQIDYQRGQAEFIGTHKEDGTDREQRDDARRAYEEIIKQSSVPRSAEVWSRVHHHWGETLGAVTDFNPYHEPAGSSEGGRFASGGVSAETSKNLETAHTMLRNLGFNTIRYEDIPYEVQDAAETSRPKHATEELIAAMRGIEQAVKGVDKNSVLAEVVDRIKEMKFAIADYAPSAGMATVTNRGLKLFMLNSANEFEPSERSKYGAYASDRANDIFDKTGDSIKALEEMYRIGFTHEMVHMADRLHDDELTQSLTDHLLRNPDTPWHKPGGDNIKELTKYLRENVSYYAGTKATETTAEIGSVYLTGGKLPEFLQSWAEQTFKKKH